MHPIQLLTKGWKAEEWPVSGYVSYPLPYHTNLMHSLSYLRLQHTGCSYDFKNRYNGSHMKLHFASRNGEKISPSWGLSPSRYLLCLHACSMFTSLQKMGGQKYVLNTDLIMSGFHLPLLDIAVFVIREPLAVQTLLPRDPIPHALIKSVLHLLLRA